MISICAAEEPKTRTRLRKRRSQPCNQRYVPLRTQQKFAKRRCGLNTLIEEVGYRTIEGSSASARVFYPSERDFGTVDAGRLPRPNQEEAIGKGEAFAAALGYEWRTRDE